MKPFTKRMRPFQAALLLATLMACPAFAQPATEAAPAETQPAPAGKDVFYASHSLMWEVPAPLAEAAEERTEVPRTGRSSRLPKAARTESEAAEDGDGGGRGGLLGWLRRRRD